MLNRGLLRFGREPSNHLPDQLVCADNLTFLAASADASVDLIYIDPPFGTGARRRGGAATPGSSWQDVPDDPVAFTSWLAPRLEHSRRLLSESGSLFVHLDYRAVHYVKVALDRIFGRSRFVNELIWCYSVGGKSRRSFARKHDTILWYARSAHYAFFADAVRVPRKSGSHMRLVTDESGELVQEKTDRKSGKVYRYPVAAGKVPEDWWTDIETLNRGDRERTGWATQKPERLLTRIIRATTATDAVVADWFCGSATTAVVAQRLGRRFIAVDAAPAAIDCATDRLHHCGEELALGGTPPRDIAISGASDGAATDSGERAYSGTSE